MIDNYFNKFDLSSVSDKVASKFNDIVSFWGNKAVKSYGVNTIEIGGIECKSVEDYVKMFNSLVQDSLKDEKAVAECKALSILYLTGLNSANTNILGVVMCVLTAINKIGSKYDIDVNEALDAYTNDVVNVGISPETSGSINKCELFGEKIDSTDTFATADDTKYHGRIKALVHDDIKTNTKDYASRQNKFKSLKSKYIADGLTKEEASKKAVEDFRKWLSDGSYDSLKNRKVLDRKRIEAEDNSDDVDL